MPAFNFCASEYSAIEAQTFRAYAKAHPIAGIATISTMFKRAVLDGQARIHRVPLAGVALGVILLCSTLGATHAGAPRAMDPRGRVLGVADFACPRPRSAPSRFGYGIQSNWPVGDIGYWNSVMAGQLKMNWTRAKVNWHEFEPAPGAPNTFQFQLFDAFVADANKKGLHADGRVAGQGHRESAPCANPPVHLNRSVSCPSKQLRGLLGVEALTKGEGAGKPAVWAFVL